MEEVETNVIKRITRGKIWGKKEIWEMLQEKKGSCKDHESGLFEAFDLLKNKNGARISF